MQARDSLNARAAKASLNVINFNKRMKGLNALMTHPDAIPLRGSNINELCARIGASLSRIPNIKNDIARRCKAHLKERQLAEERLALLSSGVIKYKSSRKARQLKV